MDLKDPTNITELRSFLEQCNVFRRFVPNFARLAASLNVNLRKDLLKKFGSLNYKKIRVHELAGEGAVITTRHNAPQLSWQNDTRYECMLCPIFSVSCYNSNPPVHHNQSVTGFAYSPMQNVSTKRRNANGSQSYGQYSSYAHISKSQSLSYEQTTTHWSRVSTWLIVPEESHVGAYIYPNSSLMSFLEQA